jgi:hypothetical protein
MRMPLAAYRLDHGTRIELAAIPKMTALRRVWSVTRRWGERVSRAGRKLHGARPAIRKVEGAGTLGSSTLPTSSERKSTSSYSEHFPRPTSTGSSRGDDDPFTVGHAAHQRREGQERNGPM